MILKLALSTMTLGLLTATPAFAHSSYWECAAASGSNEAAAANCGSRADYDRTGNLGGANAPSQSQLDEQRRQREDEDRRREDDRRRDEYRRDEDNRRRENDRLDEEARRRREELDRESYNRNNSGSYGGGSSYTPSRPARPGHAARPVASRPAAPARRQPAQVEQPAYVEDIAIPLEINQRGATLNIGAAANLGAYPGYKIKAIKVETSTTGNSQVNVLVGGVRVGGIKAIQPGEYEKDFASRAAIRAGKSNIVLTTTGDVTILRVTIVIGK